MTGRTFQGRREDGRRGWAAAKEFHNLPLVDLTMVSPVAAVFVVDEENPDQPDLRNPLW